MLQKYFITLIIVIVILFLPGCGGAKKPDGLPELHPCRIVVTLKGVPLDGAVVSLSGNEGRFPGNGLTDKQGIAVIRTHGQFLGVAEGTYKVIVSKTKSQPSKEKDKGSTEEPKPLVNPKYTSPTTTPLECIVKSGNNNFEFNVEAP